MRRKLFFYVAFGLTLYIVTEGLAFAGLEVLRKVRGLSYSPMGSSLAPDGRTNLDAFLARGGGVRTSLDSVLGWNSPRRSDINAAGMRDDRDYDPEPVAGILRISAFGDSFTHGSDVALGENWTKRISAKKPTIEILNYGVGAYGLDQAYLRYLQVGAAYKPQVVFIGYMTENLARNVNVYRGFYTLHYRDFFFTKPRFRVENDSLVLVANPLASLADYRRLSDNEAQVLGELGRNDYHYVGQYRTGLLDFSPSVKLGKMVGARIRRARQVPIFTADGRYEERSEAYEVTLRIFDAFYRKVLEDGALPIIVVLPDLNDQERSRNGKPRRYAPLLEYFRSKGYRYIDALGALEPVQQRFTISDLSVRYGHFSVLGNEIVAQYVLDNIVAQNLDDVSEVNAAAATERQRLGTITRPR